VWIAVSQVFPPRFLFTSMSCQVNLSKFPSRLVPRNAISELHPGYPRIYPLSSSGTEDYSRGWVDFHLPFLEEGSAENEEWWRRGYTFELTREGSGIDGHVQRFLPGGTYHSWLLGDSEWIVADFRMSRPKKWKPDYLGKLVFVVFLQLGSLSHSTSFLQDTGMEQPSLPQYYSVTMDPRSLRKVRL